jgi:hypothetical protein
MLTQFSNHYCNPKIQLKSNRKRQTSTLLLNHCHPNESADFAAAISRASSGDADPL